MKKKVRNMNKKRKNKIIEVPVLIDGIQAIVEECPICKERHIYGAGSGKPLEIGDELGLQIPSCVHQSPRPQFRLRVKDLRKQRPKPRQGC